jgi:hypothetical protein
MLLVKTILIFVIGFILLHATLQSHSFIESTIALYNYVIDNFTIKNIIIFSVFSFAIIIYEKKYDTYSKEMLESWAKLNGYKILETKFCNIFIGPGVWITFTNFIYLLKVIDDKGNIGEVWINLGHRGYDGPKPIWKTKPSVQIT